MKLTRIASILALASLPAMAEAPNIAAIIETRQAGFHEMGESMKVFRAVMRGGDVPAERQLEAAETVLKFAPEIGSWFPAGSGPESGLDTDALPYIWKNTEKFAGLSDDLVSAAEGLVAAVKSADKGAIVNGVRTVGGICGDCHDSYRAD